MAAGATGATDDPRPSAVDDAGAGAGTTPAEAPTTSGPCSEARQLADERCSIAERTRVAGQEAMDRLMATRREYDEHRRKLETAEAAADPRSVRDAKEAAQRAFRSSRGANVDTEAAARDWLHEINRINNAARDAQHVIDRERQVTRELLAQLDRLELEADAARIGAESAEEACLEARDAVARCEEAAQLAASPPASSWAPAGPADSHRRSVRARPIRPWPSAPTPPRSSSASSAATGRHSSGPRRPSGERIRWSGGTGSIDCRTSSRRSSRGPSRHRSWTSRRTTVSGVRSRAASAATSSRRCHRSASASTAWAAGPRSACRPSEICRWRSAMRDSTRCASATGRRTRRWTTSSGPASWRPTSGLPAPPAS